VIKRIEEKKRKKNVPERARGIKSLPAKVKGGIPAMTPWASSTKAGKILHPMGIRKRKRGGGEKSNVQVEQ